MKTTLEDLWYGNIFPNADYRKMSNKEKELLQYIARHNDDLGATLNENQKELFEKFKDCNSELSCINEKETFIYAFSLGAKIAFEVMNFKFE